MKMRKRTPLLSKYWLIILAVLCVGLLLLSAFTDGKAAGPLRGVANYTIVPMQTALNKAGVWLSDVTQNFETLEEVKQKNEELQSRVYELTIEKNNLQQQRAELERLRELYKLDLHYSEYEKIGAHVIANNGSNWFSSFVIDKGENDGIKTDMNVMAGSGLVGIVTKTGPNWAEVRSIIDDASNISAMALSTSDICIVRGDLTLMKDGRIKFEKLPKSDVEIEVGEQIVTSYTSSKYVQGILIGYISEINDDANNLTRSGYLTPVVDFEHLQEVLVITQRKSDMIEE